MTWRQSLFVAFRSSFTPAVMPHQSTVKRQFSRLQYNLSSRPLFRKALYRQTFGVHVNSQRYLHPLVILVARQLAKGLAIFTGRGFRKWWKSLPPNRRAYFAQRFRENRGKIALGLSLTGGLGSLYYISHLQRAPITGRLRFIAFSDEQMAKLTEFQHKMEIVPLRKDLFPINHAYVRRMKSVAEQLLAGNRDLPQIYEKNWSVSVIDSPLQNAFVLPNGQIYVFRGMLELCQNDDELGCILAHEMAHAVLNHSAENISYAHFVDICVVFLLAVIWAVMPSDGIAAITHWLFNKIVALMLHLPYSRKLETEADTVGLELAAKACFDVRHSSTFWAKMELLRELKNQEKIPEFLSTHPTDANRCQTLDGQIGDMLKKRMQCRCPPLPRRDPRTSIEGLRHEVDRVKKWQQEMEKEGIAYITTKR
ncbi:metalloendopeptidase OMA1, mitochondrial-like [Varroa destructor]|uniref:Metalloendopeptidase OMA1, mitochondrial n=1 Tax=Varroa destructor TaxID=109461 RepID=A0A7M7IWT7_VARDE|nr:metalloendopeptidase OMA1, mitochondrial-like [Varroa destructor]XP_022643598.1 metalloendopeptidase OMA1, mitochondrial-like [Varroa destructor]XP_022643600.1 metalloendopeptidase OMA1, mitochondrial-like [Varroa destructor]